MIERLGSHHHGASRWSWQWAYKLAPGIAASQGQAHAAHSQVRGAHTTTAPTHHLTRCYLSLFPPACLGPHHAHAAPTSRTVAGSTSTAVPTAFHRSSWSRVPHRPFAQHQSKEVDTAGKETASKDSDSCEVQPEPTTTFKPSLTSVFNPWLTSSRVMSGNERKDQIKSFAEHCGVLYALMASIGAAGMFLEPLAMCTAAASVAEGAIAAANAVPQAAPRPSGVGITALVHEHGVNLRP